MKNISWPLLVMIAFVFISAFHSEVKLEVKSLFYNKISLKVPVGFEPMSEDLMKVKYPLDQRPTLVFTNPAGSINVALNLTKNDVHQLMLESFANTLVTSFKTIYPSAKFKGHGTNVINGRKVGYVELITPALDTKIYNLIFFTDVDGKLLLCTFNCTKNYMKEWKSSAHEIMNSLKVNKL